MKLLIINYQALPLPPVKGGAVEYLVAEFLKYNEKNYYHDIVLYSVYDEKAKVESLKYKYTVFKYIKINGIFNKLDRIVRHLINKYTKFYIGNIYISKILKKEKNLDKYDAIIFENCPEFVLKFKTKYNNKLILHLHNDYLNVNTKNAKEIFDKFSEIYTISHSLGMSVKTIENSDKVKTLYNGIDLNKFKRNEETRKKLREKYSIKDSEIVFMFVGRIVPEKGVLELVKAFSHLEGKYNNIKLILVGGIGYSNDSTNDYLEKIYKYKNKNIIVTGYIPYENVSQYYQLGDIGVIPSICNDAFNLSVIEFLANGIPVVISNSGAMKELVNGECSFVVNYDQNFIDNLEKKLSYIIENYNNINHMESECKKVSKKFSIINYCINFNNLLCDQDGEKNGTM